LLGQFFDEGLVLRPLLEELFPFPHLEVLKLKAGVGGAAYEGVAAFGKGGTEPATGCDEGLEGFALGGVGAEADLFEGAVGVDHVNGEGASFVKMPEFIGFDAVQPGDVLSFQKKVDGGPTAASARKRRCFFVRIEKKVGFIRLSVVAPFGVGREVQGGDQLVNSWFHTEFL